MILHGRLELDLDQRRRTCVDRNCGDIVTGTYQNINATPAEVLVKLQLHAAEVIGIGT